MVKITVSDELQDALGRAGEVAELCDRSGRTLGHFVPVSAPGRFGDADDRPYSEAELARMKAETGADRWMRSGNGWAAGNERRGHPVDGVRGRIETSGE